MGRWLTVEEQAAWRRFLHATSRLGERLDEGLQRRHGLATTDYEILVVLSEATEHRLRMSDIADRVLISRSRLTYRVDGLTKRGLVRRESSDSDGRGMNAILTEAGLDLLERAAPGHVDDVRRFLMDQIEPDQLAAFDEIFGRVEQAVLEPE